MMVIPPHRQPGLKEEQVLYIKNDAKDMGHW